MIPATKVEKELYRALRRKIRPYSLPRKDCFSRPYSSLSQLAGIEQGIAVDHKNHHQILNLYGPLSVLQKEPQHSGDIFVHLKRCHPYTQRRDGCHFLT